MERCSHCLDEAGIHCTAVPKQPLLEILINGNENGRILFQNGAWRLGRLNQPIDQCPIFNNEVTPEEFWGKIDDFSIAEGKLVVLSPNQAAEASRRNRIRIGYP